MANPFFEQNRFPWAREEAKALLRVLAQLITQFQKIDLLYKGCSNNLPALTPGQNSELTWKEALEQIALLGVLQALCDAVKPLSPTIAEAVRNVEAAESARSKRVISDDVMMLDRVKLRDHLGLLEQENSPIKVLLVRGGKGSGKSHGRYLFEQSAREQGADAVYLKGGMVATVDEVVYKLFAVLKATDKIPPRDTTPDGWYRVVCFKLQEQAAIRGRPLWIAVDDLGPGPDGAPLLDKDIRRFCEQFALNLMDPSFRNWFRIMLIHYPEGKVPTHWTKDLWREDRCAEADVTAQDVAALLRAWSEQKGRGIVEDELHVLADKVIAEAEAPLPVEPGDEPLPRLQRINDALHNALNDLGGPGE